jgi:hypothetical protein
MTKILSLRWWPENDDLREVSESGARLRCITAAPAISHNIYHEQPRSSADGNRLAVFRTMEGGHQVPGDLLVYDIKNYRLAYLSHDASRWERGICSIATSSWSGQLFAMHLDGGQRRIVRYDLNTLESEELFGWDEKLGLGFQSISPDGCWGIASGRIEQRTFGIFRVDLKSGHSELIHENPHIVNPHLQYRLHSGSRIMVQENRGSLMDADGNVVRPYDERGVGLYSIASAGGDRRDFPVGPPHTAATTGHECWIGDSDRALVTLTAPYDDGVRCGNVLEVSHEWEKPRVVFDSPHIWNHVAASRCGRFLIADGCHDPATPILIGHIESGRTRVLCDARTGGGAQYTHAHPYLTADNRWVVFNSKRTGLPQVYLARVPDGFLEELCN